MDATNTYCTSCYPFVAKNSVGTERLTMSRMRDLSNRPKVRFTRISPVPRNESRLNDGPWG